MNHRTATSLKLVRSARDLGLVCDGLCCDQMPADIGRCTDSTLTALAAVSRQRSPPWYPGRMQ